MKNFIVCALTFVLVVLGMSATTVSAAELPYEISKGSVYYESAYGFGSGRSGIVSDSNPYANTPCRAAINGYAFLDESGKILESAYEETETDIYIPEAPEGTTETFVHFRTYSYRNGWCIAETVIDYSVETPSEKSEATPEEVAAEIKEVIEHEEKKTALVIDYSGSMADNQEQVIELLKTFELEDTPIIVFAETYQQVTAEQLENEDFYVGVGTYLIHALNAVSETEAQTLIVISDLETWTGDTLLPKSPGLKNVKIYDPDDSEGYDAEVMALLESTWGGVPIERVRIK